MGVLAESARGIEQLMRLRTFPIGLKMLERLDELNEIPKVRQLNHKEALCQLVSLARIYGWTVAATSNDLASPNCRSIVGLAETDESILNGSFTAGTWEKTLEDASKHQKSIRRIPPGRYEAIVLGPAAGEKFEPDVVLFYGTPAQIILMVNGLQWEDYRRIEMSSVGESACSDSIVQSFLNQEPTVAIPCLAERRFGGVAEDELVMAMPPRFVPKMLDGLRGLWAAGTIRYPIPTYGALCDPTEPMMQVYADKASANEGVW